jgi:cyclopropane-fatty-acyl-phospholipid synthase
MAGRKELDYTYSLIDKIFRLSFGESGDFSGALYDGDFTLSLEDAQARKHGFIADSLGITAGSCVLDMGCGWGGFLEFVRKRGATGVGVTLSEAQMAACRRNGLDVHLMDCRTIQPETFGTFDAVTCIGAFEAFCSREDWQAGEQDRIYRSFFETVSGLLKPKRRFYMQTMVFGKNMPVYEKVDIHAPKNSDPRILALLEKQFPGHWLPYGSDQIIRAAGPHFDLVNLSSGRQDYIETQKQWSRKFRSFNLRKYVVYLSLVPRYLLDGELRRRINPFEENANRLCFEREILDHFRMVFEKT